MSIRKSGYLTVLLIFVFAILVVVGAWSRNDWDLKKTALVGESAAPIVGILSLIAVVAALWSVRIQIDALDLQRKGSSEQLNLQQKALEHQQEELLHQRKALEDELRYRRHATLREAYVPFMSATSAYLDALHEYFKLTLRTNGVIDRRIRSEWQGPCKTRYEELKRTLPPVLLVDTNKERQEHRWRIPREVHLNPPPSVDTPENQKDWSDVLLYRITELSHHYVVLRDLLLQEFGAEVEERSASTIQGEESMREDSRKKAKVVEDRITAQLKALVKADAVRSGRVPASQTDKDG